MQGELDLAKYTLFDQAGLNVTDVKLFPGNSRDITVDQMAQQVNHALAQLANGDFEEIQDDPDA